MSAVFETVAKDGVIRLPSVAPASARCLVAVIDEDLDSLRADADTMLPESKRRRMSELLEKNRDGQLTPDESQELDALAEEFDAATLAKGRAIALLSQLGFSSTPALTTE